VPRFFDVVSFVSEISCVVPGCPNQAEHWHYVKHQKKARAKNNHKIILALTAKQIPVCALHYRLIHAGKYNGQSLRKMKGYVLSDFD
jgi:hypothetical protein